MEIKDIIIGDYITFSYNKKQYSGLIVGIHVNGRVAAIQPLTDELDKVTHDGFNQVIDPITRKHLGPFEDRTIFFVDPKRIKSSSNNYEIY